VLRIDDDDILRQQPHAGTVVDRRGHGGMEGFEPWVHNVPSPGPYGGCSDGSSMMMMMMMMMMMTMMMMMIKYSVDGEITN
jgi:hypothetical protein